MNTRHFWLVAVFATASAVGCGKPPKQVDAPMVADTGGSDMAVEEPKELAPAKKMPDEMSATEQKQLCCGQCEKGLANDKTGQAAAQIPCADYIASGEVKDFCKGYFQKNPLKGADCKGQGAAEKPADKTDKK